MTSKPELSLYDFGQCVESSLVTGHCELGICEVISVGPCHEVPYVFAIGGRHRLSFSLTSSHEVDLILRDARAYNEWVDDGLQTDHPLEAILAPRHACHHSLEVKPEQDTTLTAININIADSPVQSVVAASILDSTGKPC